MHKITLCTDLHQVTGMPPGAGTHNELKLSSVECRLPSEKQQEAWAHVEALLLGKLRGIT